MPTHKPKKWYAIYTRSRTEKKVHEQLKSAGFEVYLPLMTTMRQWSDRKKKVKTPLIPSYVFIKTEETLLNKALAFNGVVRVLKYLGKNAIIQDHEIESLRILSINDYDFQLTESRCLQLGDEIEITTGSLTGVKGYFVQEKNKHRIIIKIEALNSFVNAEIPLNYIK